MIEGGVEMNILSRREFGVQNISYRPFDGHCEDCTFYSNRNGVIGVCRADSHLILEHPLAPRPKIDCKGLGKKQRDQLRTSC